ncbi:MAG: hypothetical protein HY816_20040 [Candidatus Wallbacteria bacterium]|nr:hypothetical protein [Candidatus Wallbacteria bacterium]
MSTRSDGTLYVDTHGLSVNPASGTVRTKCRACKLWQSLPRGPVVKALVLALSPSRKDAA